MNRLLQSKTVETQKPRLDATAQRKQMLEHELHRFVKLLVEHENPDLILVFGSMVTGEIHEWSDIDLVVVQDSDQPFLARTWQVRKMLRPQVGADILCYTPDEFNHMFHHRLFFRQEIVGKGKILYERRNNTLARLCERRPAHSRVSP